MITMDTNPPYPSGTESNAARSRHVDIFDVLIHRWLMLLLGAVLGVLIAISYCITTPPVHEATTELLILTKQAGLANQSSPLTNDAVGFDYAMQNEMLATHLHILQSPSIVRTAIEANSLSELESVRKELTPTVIASGDPQALLRATDGYIRRNLEVERAGSTETRGAQVMKASFRHSSAEDGALILSSIVQAYETAVDKIIREFGGEAAALIREERDNLENELVDYDKQYAEFVRNSPLHAQSSADAVNPHAARLAELESELARVRIAEANALSRLALVDRVIAKDEISVDELSMIDASDVPRLNLLIEVDRNTPTAPVAAEYERLRELESERTKLALRLGPNHPKVSELRAQISEITANSSAGAPSLESIRNEDGINPRRLATGYAELLRHDLADFQRSIEAVTTLIDKELEASRVLVEAELQQRRHIRQMERAEAAYDALMDRIGQLDLMSSYAGFANAVLKPVEAGNKVWPHVPLLVVAGAFLGGLLGAVLAFVSEVRDTSYRSPGEVEESLSVPVLSHLPAIRKPKSIATSEVRRSVFAVHEPSSPEAEAIRKLRGSLFFKTNSLDRPIIQITSPGLKQGKSTLLSNLAASTAQSRRRVLMVDCNFRSPKLAEIFGIETGAGLADVLVGEATVEESIHMTPVEGLSLVPAGHLRSDSADLFTMPEFRHFMKQVSENFDYVFVDSPAVLRFSESMAIADSSDFVIVTFGISQDSRAASHEAITNLQSHGCDVMGVVVNEFNKPTSYVRDQFASRVELAVT